MSSDSGARIHLEYKSESPDLGAHWEAKAVDINGNLFVHTFDANHECILEIFGHTVGAPLAPKQATP